MIEPYSPEEVSYHVELLEEAGLIEVASFRTTAGSTHWHIGRLTWNGHEFLDAARDEGRWKKAKEIIRKKGGDLTFDVVKALLIQLTREAVGLS